MLIGRHGLRITWTALFLLCGVVLAVVSTMAAWFITVPELVTSSSFFAVAALLGGSAWVTATSYIDGRPANSLAQSLHDIDIAAAADRARRIR